MVYWKFQIRFELHNSNALLVEALTAALAHSFAVSVRSTCDSA